MPRATPAKRTPLVEKRARAVCGGLARATESGPMHWRTVDSIADGTGVDEAAADDAIAYAVGREWILSEGQPPHIICLTEGGRVRVAKLKRR